MAKFKIPKVIRDLDLDDFYGSGESHIIKIWVNPPISLQRKFDDTKTEATELLEAIVEAAKDDKNENERLAKAMIENSNNYYAMFSTLWSQDKDDETRWSTDEVAEFQKQCLEHDPGLWKFVTTMTVGMINDYSNKMSKKGSRR